MPTQPTTAAKATCPSVVAARVRIVLVGHRGVTNARASGTAIRNQDLVARI
jgi:hypothetical protein